MEALTAEYHEGVHELSIVYTGFLDAAGVFRDVTWILRGAVDGVLEGIRYPTPITVIGVFRWVVGLFLR